jgi:4-hydroxybenzoate polyprenyltransferase
LFILQFYHACDTNHVYQLCILNYGALAFSDFFGSVLSFFAVLTSMCRIPGIAQTFLLVCGALVIATFQDNDRHNELSHILPLVAIGLILVGSWVGILFILFCFIYLFFCGGGGGRGGGKGEGVFY